MVLKSDKRVVLLEVLQENLPDQITEIIEQYLNSIANSCVDSYIIEKNIATISILEDKLKIANVEIQLPCRAEELVSAINLNGSNNEIRFGCFVYKPFSKSLHVSSSGQKHHSLSDISSYCVEEADLALDEEQKDCASLKHTDLHGSKDSKGASVSASFSSSVKSSVNFTEKEHMLFLYLLQNYPKRISKYVLLSEVWGYSDSIETKTLESHVYSVRNKLRSVGLNDILKYNNKQIFIEIDSNI